jgi:hypothetical protein
MAGYSGTPLPKKLGIKEGHRLAFLSAPERFEDELGDLTEMTVARSLAGKSSFDVIVMFTKSRAELAKKFATVAKRLDPDGGFWVAWPKKSSNEKTDLTEDVVRNIALEVGLVDNKVCAIDETWSGLRCVYRKKDRVARR